MSVAPKKTVLLVGGGSVGAIGALNLEVGGLAEVTVVLRSNYERVASKGYLIESCQHGKIESFKPTHVRNSVPDIQKEGLPPYDYIVLTTKNCPDIPPTVADLIRPALTQNNTHTAIVLIQNGLNIEKPLIAAYPTTPILSGVSLIGSAEPQPGHIVQEDRDKLFISPFDHPTLPFSLGQEKAKDFVHIYGAGGKTEPVYRGEPGQVSHDRWRKLVYNAALNPICAILDLDTGRVRLADQGAIVEGLVRPAMREIVDAARACGVAEMEVDIDRKPREGREGEEPVVQYMIDVDPVGLYLRPSMQADVRKGNYIEFENLLGEPLREGKKKGVPMPTLEVLYNIAKGIQWRTKEHRGLVKVPPKAQK